MSDVTVRVEGMSGLRRALLSVAEEGRKTAERETLRAALNVQRGAKERCPVRTGRLRNSIAIDRDDALRPTVGTNVGYAEFVEFGTRRMAAKPYLFPAWEEEFPQFLERLRAQLGAAFVKAARSGGR